MSRGALLLKPLETAPGLHPLGGDQETKQHGRQEDEKSHTPNLNIIFLAEETMDTDNLFIFHENGFRMVPEEKKGEV